MTSVIDLDQIRLDTGSHTSANEGHCLLEVVSMFAREPFTDAPQCVSPYLRSFGISLNDRATDERRQDLKRFIPALPGTASDGLDEQRRWMGADHAIRIATPRWLHAAGLIDHAVTLRALAPIVDQATYTAARSAVIAARDAAYQLQRDKLGGKTRYRYVYDAVRAKLAELPDAAAVADADAAAAAVADAVADAVAVAVADYSYGTTAYWDMRNKVYAAVRAVYEERYGDLIAQSWADALGLFERLILIGASS